MRPDYRIFLVHVPSVLQSLVVVVDRSSQGSFALAIRAAMRHQAESRATCCATAERKGIGNLSFTDSPQALGQGSFIPRAYSTFAISKADDAPQAIVSRPHA